MKEYNRANIPLAKTLRKNMTPWERKLWYDFFKKLPGKISKAKSHRQLYSGFLLCKGGFGCRAGRQRTLYPKTERKRLYLHKGRV